MSTLTTSLASSDVGMCMCVGCNVIQHVIINDTAIVNLEVIGSKSLTLLIMLCLKQLYIIIYIPIDYVTNTCTHF